MPSHLASSAGHEKNTYFSIEYTRERHSSSSLRSWVDIVSTTTSWVSFYKPDERVSDVLYHPACKVELQPFSRSYYSTWSYIYYMALNRTVLKWVPACGTPLLCTPSCTPGQAGLSLLGVDDYAAVVIGRDCCE